MSDYEVLAPGGHAHLIGKVKERLGLKADIDGHYELLVAGSADNLTGHGDCVGAEYTIRTTGGSYDVADGVATIKSIRGRTMAWNQLCGNDGTTNTTGLTVTRNEDGSITLDGTSAGGYVIVSDSVRIVRGHSYLLRGCPDGGGTDTYNLNVSGVVHDVGGGYVFVPTTSTTNRSVRFDVGADITVSNMTVWPQLYDLTLIFGAGNEPDIEGFVSVFSDTYYERCDGKLLGANPSAIRTVGFNAYDPSTGRATVISGNEYQIGGAYTSVTYDDGREIEPDENGIFVPDKTCEISVSGGNSTDTVVHLTWSGYRNGEWEPHWESERTTGVGRYFPDGLHRVGATYDELTESVAVRRVGSVDLGTLEWDQPDGDSYPSVFCATVTGKAPGNEIRCLSYEYDGTSSSYQSLSGGGMLCDGSTLYVCDTAYGTVSDFKAAVDGVMLQYALSVPEERQVNPPLNLTYKVSDFGIEQVIGPSGAEPVTTPVPMVVSYTMNAVDAIRNLPEHYASKDMIAAIEGPLGIGITETRDDESKTYEYSVDEGPHAPRNLLRFGHRLLGNVPKATLEGDSVTVRDAYAAPPISVSIDGASTQDGVPTPASPASIESIGSVTLHASDGRDEGTGWPVTIDLDGTSLCALPDGTSDGLDVSYVGQGENGGTFSVTVTKRVAVAEISTTDGNWLTNPTTGGFEHVRGSLPRNMGTEAAKLCNAQDGGRVSTGWNNIRIEPSGSESLTDFIEAMDGQPVVVLYALGEPEVRDLGTVELPDLPAPRATAWVETEPSVPVTLSYERDINIVLQTLAG